MAYNKQYYDERKKDLEEDFNKLKEKTFAQIITAVNQWNQDSMDLQKKFQDLSKREIEAQKEVLEGKKLQGQPIEEPKKEDAKN